MLNFDNLPKDRPGGSVVEKGTYLATVKTAVMKKSSAGNPYLEVQLNCTSLDGSCSTTVFDKLFDSDKPLLQYKLAQFIRALQLNLRGNFELKDLAKIIIDKKCMVALKIEQSEGYADKNVVDVFDNFVFSPVSPTDNSDLPFDASDAADANRPAEGTGSY